MIDTESGQQITGIGEIGSYSPAFDSAILSSMTNWEMIWMVQTKVVYSEKNYICQVYPNKQSLIRTEHQTLSQALWL